jgi:putative ABC transport system permease protein
MLSIIDSILFEALPYAFLALGLVLTFRYLRVIDLTFAASFAAAPAIAGALLIAGSPFWFAMAAAALVAVALAITTVALVWLLELDELLASILTSMAGFSIALFFTQGTLSLHNVDTPIRIVEDFDYGWLENGLPLHPAQIAFFALFLLLTKVLVDSFLQSELGLAFRAMEDERSRRSLLPSIGISYWKLLGGGIVFGNILCAISGVLIMLKEGQVTANRGFDAFLTVIAAYLFGILLFERRARRAVNGSFLERLLARIAVFGATTAAIFGVLFYFTILTIVSRLNVPSSIAKLLMVCLVIGCFIVSRWPDLRSRSRPKGEVTLSASDVPFEAAGVHVEYPGYPKPNIVLHGVHLRLDLGKATLLKGANGSGKSTLLRYLSGRVRGRGDILVPSRNQLDDDRRTKLVGYVSQEAQYGSVATLSVSENLALFATNGTKSIWRHWRALNEDEIPAPARALLVASIQPADSLSGGQRQLLGIAALLVRSDAPQVILFDEPLTHLDEENALGCVALMENLVAQGRALLVVQHDVDTGIEYGSSPARSRLARLLTHTIYLDEINQRKND